MAVPAPELDLPWVRLEGEPKKGPPRLNRQNLFLLACREAFRNGRLSDTEKQFLSKFAGALQLPAKDARGFAMIAKQEAADGKIEGKEDLDPKMVFKKACALAQAKGKLDQGERQILGNFSDALGVPMMRVNATLRMLAVQIEDSARDEKSSIGLAKDRNVDGSQAEPAAPDWGEGDPLTQSGIMRLGVHTPTRPGRARVPSTAPRRGPVGGPPVAPESDSPKDSPVAQARKDAAFELGTGALLAGGGLWGLNHCWFVAETVSLPLLFFAGLALLAGLIRTPLGLYHLVRPRT